MSQPTAEPGGFDFGALLRQAQQIQAELSTAQASLSDTMVTGSAGDGAVTVQLDGRGEVLSVTIDPQTPGLELDADTAELVGDLVVAAYRDARARADAAAEERMQRVAQQSGLTDMMSGLLGTSAQPPRLAAPPASPTAAPPPAPPEPRDA
jgi:hypothetical protein